MPQVVIVFTVSASDAVRVLAGVTGGLIAFIGVVYALVFPPPQDRGEPSETDTAATAPRTESPASTTAPSPPRARGAARRTQRQRSRVSRGQMGWNRRASSRSPDVEAGYEWWFAFFRDERREVAEKMLKPPADDRSVRGLYQLIDGEGHVVLPGG